MALAGKPLALRDGELEAFARFRRQYLQLQPNLDFPDARLLTRDYFQVALYERIFKEKAIEYAPPARYTLRVLKQLTKKIQASIKDWEEEGISDDLMDTLAQCLSAPMPPEAVAAQQKCYITYTISNITAAPTITLLESPTLLSAAGTTGLRTWEAALHLGQYLSWPHHRERQSTGNSMLGPASNIVHNQRVLELGAGTGYLSILAARHLGAKHVIATDGSPEVLSSISTNIFLNGLENPHTVASPPADDRSRQFEVKELTWGSALVGTESPFWNNLDPSTSPVDVVLGADITYHKSVLPALIATLSDLVELYPRVVIYIAATIRNRETLEAFLDGVSKTRGPGALEYEDVEWEEGEKQLKRENQMGPFYETPEAVGIRIAKIYGKRR